MPLSYVVEKLLSSLDDSGNARIFQGTIRIAINGLLPTARSVSLLSVASNNYAMIIYRVVINPTVVPGTLYMVMNLNGVPVYDAVVDGALIVQPYDIFTLSKVSTPGRMTITNVSGLAQNFEAIVEYLNIQNETDYKYILDILSKIKGGL